MKGIVKWLAGIVGSALTLVLVIVLLPHAPGLLDRLLPGRSGVTVETAQVISERLKESARLETLRVVTDGVVTARVDAAFIGTVSSVDASYQYTGCYGIDLQKVEVRIQENRLVFTLPVPELLIDDIVVVEVSRDGFLDSAVRISDAELQELLDAEKLKYRDQYLTGDRMQELRTACVRAMEDTVYLWLSQMDASAVCEFVWADTPGE